MVIPKRKGEFYSPLTDGVLRNHLEHKYAVAVFAGERSSRFLCFDVDDGRRETVGEVIGALMEMGFPRCGIHVSLSGGKGYHIEVFFDKLVRTEKLKRIYQRVLDLTELTVRQVEFRPTNSNAIKLPLSVHAVSYTHLVSQLKNSMYPWGQNRPACAAAIFLMNGSKRPGALLRPHLTCGA